MKYYLEEIKKALDNQLYLVALLSCLAIPDICGAIESDNGNATKNKYVSWYDQYAATKISSRLLALDCYYFRCSMLHQGTTIPNPRTNDAPSFNRIIFIAPDDNRFMFHDNIMYGDLNIDLNIDLHIFCKGIIEGTEEWITKMEREGNANYKRNIAKLIRYYPKGMAPYATGISVIG